jgi:succinate--hydroxymethylglutarate CoA-transferase
VSHPTAGALELVNPPFSFEGASLAPMAAPPLLGQHTMEVLAELGLGEERLAELERRGVIARPAA